VFDVFGETLWVPTDKKHKEKEPFWAMKVHAL
jgi:hypothetical protein